MIAIALTVGAITSAVFTVAVLASWRRDPEIWIADLTEGRVPAPRTLALYLWTALIIAITIVGPVAAAWWSAADQDASFWSRVLVAWVVVAIVSLVDLVVVDVGVYIWLSPSWMAIPGYEPLRAVWPHIKASVVGLAIGVPVALLAAVLTTVV